jgi:heterodisulfide reductase subunit B
MKYIYYPGCTLEGSAIEYHHSTLAMMAALGAELEELEDWTCCGASAVEPVSYLLSLALPARNLALAQRQGGTDILIPCSACYLNLRKVDDHIQRDPQIRAQVNAALEVEGLNYQGGMRARHLLDVVAHDIGPEPIRKKLSQRLSGLRVAPYYGCQALRPYPDFDDPERPTCMEPIIEALGAEVFPWSMGARCCAAGLATTKKKAALPSIRKLLRAARGADCIVTVCPMCQMNLESYQSQASRLEGEDLKVSILYLPQLIGLGLGLSEDTLRIGLNLAVTSEFKSKVHALGSQIARPAA